MSEIEIFGATWCPDCRRAKKFLTDQRVPFVWHDIEVRPELVEEVERRNEGKRIIPTIVFPDGSHLAEPTNEEIADKLGIPRVAEMHCYDVIIVGGGPSGLTTAIYAARENLDTLVIDSKGLGGQAGVTEKLDNYPGFPEGIGGAELADRFVRQAERYDVEMLQAVSVTGIAETDTHLLEVRTATGDHYDARAVLLATGSSYRRTGAKGEEDLIGAGVHFCATCDGPFYKGSDELLVIGGGNSGLEEGLFLAQFTDKVTVVEFADRLLGSQILQDKVMNHPKMEVFLNHSVQEFAPKDDGSGKLGTVRIEDRETGEVIERHPGGGVRLHRARSQHRLPRRDRRAGRAPVRHHRRHVHDRPTGGVRGRRRARRLDQAAGLRRGRRCGRRDRDPRLPRPGRRRGGRVMTADPDEIFELILKADEKLKYATAATGDVQGAAGGRPVDPGDARRRGDRERGSGAAGARAAGRPRGDADGGGSAWRIRLTRLPRPATLGRPPGAHRAGRRAPAPR